jgi:hypothetical protein
MAENRGGTCPPKKAHGGAAGMRAVHSRGNDSEADLMADGHKGRHRIARKTGGKVPKTSITVHVHPRPHVMLPAQGTPAGGPMMQAAGPMPAGGPMAGPAAGLMAPGMAPGQGGPPPIVRARGGHVHNSFEHPNEDISSYREATPHRAAGGHVKAGAFSGVARKQMYEKMKREGN